MNKIYFILSLIFSGNALASAEISIGTLYDYMSGQQSTYLKRIRNQGDATAFVKVAIHEISYDAAGQPQESAELTERRRALDCQPVPHDYSGQRGAGDPAAVYGRGGQGALFQGPLYSGIAKAGGWVRSGCQYGTGESVASLGRGKYIDRLWRHYFCDAKREPV
ncbi:hypothetical protein ACFU5E_16890 [Aeromonas bestiarum]|uniref:hypothetical protein n=1 Tax=Aeromonas TaxID=642 RepID=UPI0020A3C95A|nr:hypothetical protein [Aeromonas sp. CA23]